MYFIVIAIISVVVVLIRTTQIFFTELWINHNSNVYIIHYSRHKKRYKNKLIPIDCLPKSRFIEILLLTSL